MATRPSLGDRDGFEREVERSRGEIGNEPAHDVWRFLQLLGDAAPLGETLEAHSRACPAGNVDCAEGRAVLESSADDARQKLIDRLARQRENTPWLAHRLAHTTAWLAAYFGEQYRIFGTAGTNNSTQIV